MTPAEAAVLLARIAASDNREVTESASRAWAESLPDVALADAMEFLPGYYREATRDTRNWIYPGDVLEGVRALHKKRRARAFVAARQAFLEAAGVDDMDTDLAAARAGKLAALAYDEEHPVRPDEPRALPAGYEFGQGEIRTWTGGTS